jgi:S1-C subfamily serine protease
MARVTGLSTFLLLISYPTLQGQEHAPINPDATLQLTIGKIIQHTEKSVACLLISRSDAYRHYFGEEPGVDIPGKLGSFVPDRKLAFPSSFAELSHEDGSRYDLANPNYIPESFGSGVVIESQGKLILTSYHVVHDATKIYVRLAEGKGSYADIFAADPRSDLALLRVLNKTVLSCLTPLKIGKAESVQKGDLVVLVSKPFSVGFHDGSTGCSWGIISKVRRRIQPRSLEDAHTRLQTHGTLLQVNARLSLDCSGGALLNLHGDLVGLTTERATLVGTDVSGELAIPMDPGTRRILGSLCQGFEAEYGFLGVVPGQSNSGTGIVLVRVTPGSPAYTAGIRAGDVLESINGIPVYQDEDLFLQIGSLLPGCETELKIRGRQGPVRVRLAKLYVAGSGIVSRKPPAVRGIRVDYTSVLYLQTLRTVSIPPGIYVREVVPGSRAQVVDLRLNEIITHVNGQEVNSPAAFYREAAKSAPTEPLKLTLSAQDLHRAESTEILIP